MIVPSQQALVARVVAHPTAMGQSFIMTLYKDFFFQEARLKRFKRKKPLEMLRRKQLSGAFTIGFSMPALKINLNEHPISFNYFSSNNRLC
jgi:hypothetical protein